MASGQIFTAMLLLSSSPTLLRESSLPHEPSKSIRIFAHNTRHVVGSRGHGDAHQHPPGVKPGSTIYGSSYTSHTSYTRASALALCAQIPPVPHGHCRVPSG